MQFSVGGQHAQGSATQQPREEEAKATKEAPPAYAARPQARVKGALEERLTPQRRYFANAFSRSVSSSHGSRQMARSAARCFSAFGTSPTMRYASPMYSWAPRWRGSSSIARL